MNCAVADTNKSYVGQMSSDLVNDLQDAFDFYDEKHTGFISIQHFRNIMQNFGYHSIGIRDANDELRKLDQQFSTRNCVDIAFVKEVIAFRQYKGSGKEPGKDEEARECFRLFDKRDRNYITAVEIRHVLDSHIEFPITEQDVSEFIEEVDSTGTG